MEAYASGGNGFFYDTTADFSILKDPKKPWTYNEVYKGVFVFKSLLPTGSAQ